MIGGTTRALCLGALALFVFGTAIAQAQGPKTADVTPTR